MANQTPGQQVASSNKDAQDLQPLQLFMNNPQSNNQPSTQPLQSDNPNPAPGEINTFNDPRSGAPSGAVTSNGNTYLGLNKSDVNTLAQQEANKNALPANANPIQSPADYAQNIALMAAKAQKEMQAKIDLAHQQLGYSDSQQAADLAAIGFNPSNPTQQQLNSITPAESMQAKIEEGAKNAATSGAGVSLGAVGIGAAIGTAITPGAGTAVGAGIGALVGFLHGYMGAETSQITADTNAQYKDYLMQKTNVQKIINDLHAGASPAGATSEYQQAINRMNIDYNAMLQSTKSTTGSDRTIAIAKMATVHAFLQNRGNIGGSDQLLREAIMAPNPTKVANLLNAQDYADVGVTA